MDLKDYSDNETVRSRGQDLVSTLNLFPNAFRSTYTYRLKVTTFFFIHVHVMLDICLLFVVYTAAAAAVVDLHVYIFRAVRRLLLLYERVLLLGNGAFNK